MAAPRPTDLLREAVDAGRAALRDLEADEVPPRLRRVAASSERNLPAPLAMALLRALDGDEFLRGKALEAWDGEAPPAGGGALASYAFLERDEGWALTVAAEAAARGERRGAAADRSLQLERDSLAAEVASLKERLRRERDEFDRERRELREALEAERAPTRSLREAERQAARELGEAEEAWRRREQELTDELERVASELRRAQESARAERRARAEIEAATSSGDTAFPSDPVALARLLDGLAAHVTALQAPPRRGSEAPAERPRPTLSLDPSIRPDTAEAVDWLAGSGASSVVVDGYNLGFQLAGLDAERARARAVEAVRRLAAVVPATAVTIVFDSNVEDAAGSPEVKAGAAAVAFTSGGSADDEIVDRACAGEAAVVVSNDRDLRHRAEACGAVVLWSDALVEWSRRR